MTTSSARSRIMLVTTAFHPEVGGIQRYLLALVEEWQARGDDVVVVTTPRQSLPSLLRVEHVALPGLGGSEDANELAVTTERLRALTERTAPDVIHLGHAGLALFVDAMPAFTPIVAHVHGKDLAAPWQRAPAGVDVRAAVVAGLNRCTVKIAVSAFTADVARSLGVTAPIDVVRPGLAETGARALVEHRPPTPALHASTRRALGIADDAFVALTVARLVPRKNHATTIDAMKHVPSMHFVVAGDGPQKGELELLADFAGVRERVHFLGVVDDEHLAALYAAADVFVLVPTNDRESGDFEGFGLSYLEAARASLPSIGSLDGGSVDAISDGVTGLLVPAASREALCAAMARMRDDAALRARVGRNARNAVVAHGTFTRVADRIEELVERRA